MWASASSSTILCCWSWPNRMWCLTIPCETRLRSTTFKTPTGTQVLFFKVVWGLKLLHQPKIPKKNVIDSCYTVVILIFQRPNEVFLVSLVSQWKNHSGAHDFRTFAFFSTLWNRAVVCRHFLYFYFFICTNSQCLCRSKCLEAF